MAKSPRKITVGVVITAPERAALEEAAADADMTLSTYTRGVLSRHLTRTGRLPDTRRSRAQEEPQGDAA